MQKEGNNRGIYKAITPNDLKTAAELLLTSVGQTLGAQGKNVLLPNKLTNDGATIASHIGHQDPIINRIVEYISEASLKTNDEVGDGTTTAMVLACNFILDGNVPSLANIMSELELSAREITSADLPALAEITSENADIAKNASGMFQELMSRGNTDPTVKIEQGDDISYTVYDGTELSVGYAHDALADEETKEADLKDVHVLVLDREVDNARPLSELLTKLAKDQDKEGKGMNVIVVAPKVPDSFLAQSLILKQQGVANVVIVYPKFTDSARTIMDIKNISGAKAPEHDAYDITKVDIEHLGKVDRVIIGKYKTRIISSLENLPKADQERLGTGVGVLHLHAKTKGEFDYLYLKAKDTVASLKTAIRGGIVEGGGYALHQQGISSPFFKILENADLNNLPTDPINVKTGKEIKNHFTEGIIDPLLTVQTSLEVAHSIARTLLSAGGIIYNEYGKESTKKDI